jgi:hypothetical protein
MQPVNGPIEHPLSRVVGDHIRSWVTGKWGKSLEEPSPKAVAPFPSHRKSGWEAGRARAKALGNPLKAAKTQDQLDQRRMESKVDELVALLLDD